MKKVFLIGILFASLNAYQFENKEIESVSKVIQEEYLKCLGSKKNGFSECNSIKEKKLNNLYDLDSRESYASHMAKVKEERAIKSKLPPEKLSSSAETIKSNMDYCLDQSLTVEDNKACIKSLQEGKFRVKQQHDPIKPKNKVHIETENEKPDLSTLFSNKIKSAPAEIKPKYSVENRVSELKNDKTATIIKKIEEIPNNQEPVVPKKKVRFKN